jgi:hypothetical protein
VRSNPAYVVYVVWKFNTICPMNSQVNCKAKVEKYVKEATMYGRKKLEQMSRKNALAAWHCVHRVHLQDRRSRVRIPPGCKVVMS